MRTDSADVTGREPADSGAAAREHRDDIGGDRRLQVLERLLGLDAVDLDVALGQAALIIAEALAADKVDVFVFEPATETLVALGISDTPMGRSQQKLGLHRLPLANGGRAARVYLGGRLHVDGRVDRDREELAGIKEDLGVRSSMLCPLQVDGERRGVLAAFRVAPERFSDADVLFFRTVAHWLGLVMHRAELVERLAGSAEERGRRGAIMDRMKRLTPRQREVATMIARGLTNDQIAQRLVLTPGTVANHVEHILRRLDAGNRVEIATLAVEVRLRQPRGNGLAETEQLS